MIRTCRDAFRTVEGSYIRKEKFKPVFNELGQVKEVISESPVKEFEAKPKIKCPHCQSDNVQKKISEFTAKTSKKS